MATTTSTNYSDWESQFAVILEKTRQNLSYRPSPFRSLSDPSRSSSRISTMGGLSSVRDSVSLPPTPTSALGFGASKRYAPFREAGQSYSDGGRYGSVHGDLELETSTTAADPTPPQLSDTSPTAAAATSIRAEFGRMDNELLMRNEQLWTAIHQHLQALESRVAAQEVQLGYQSDMARVQVEAMQRDFSKMRQAMEHEFNARIGMVDTIKSRAEEEVHLVMEKWRLQHLRGLSDSEEQWKRKVLEFEREKEQMRERFMETDGHVDALRNSHSLAVQKLNDLVGAQSTRIDELRREHQQQNMKIESTHSLLLQKIHVVEEQSREDTISLNERVEQMYEDVVHRFEQIDTDGLDMAIRAIRETHSDLSKTVDKRFQRMEEQFQQQDRDVRDAIQKARRAEEDIIMLQDDIQQTADKVKHAEIQSRSKEKSHDLAIDSIRDELEEMKTSVGGLSKQMAQVEESAKLHIGALEQKIETLTLCKDDTQRQLRELNKQLQSRERMTVGNNDASRQSLEKMSTEMNEIDRKLEQNNHVNTKKWDELTADILQFKSLLDDEIQNVNTRVNGAVALQKDAQQRIDELKASFDQTSEKHSALELNYKEQTDLLRVAMEDAIGQLRIEIDKRFTDLMNTFSSTLTAEMIRRVETMSQELEGSCNQEFYKFSKKFQDIEERLLMQINARKEEHDNHMAIEPVEAGRMGNQNAKTDTSDDVQDHFGDVSAVESENLTSGTSQEIDILDSSLQNDGPLDAHDNTGLPLTSEMTGSGEHVMKDYEHMEVRGVHDVLDDEYADASEEYLSFQNNNEAGDSIQSAIQLSQVFSKDGGQHEDRDQVDGESYSSNGGYISGMDQDEKEITESDDQIDGVLGEEHIPDIMEQSSEDSGFTLQSSYHLEETLGSSDRDSTPGADDLEEAATEMDSASIDEILSLEDYAPPQDEVQSLKEYEYDDDVMNLTGNVHRKSCLREVDELRGAGNDESMDDIDYDESILDRITESLSDDRDTQSGDRHAKLEDSNNVEHDSNEDKIVSGIGSTELGEERHGEENEIGCENESLVNVLHDEITSRNTVESGNEYDVEDESMKEADDSISSEKSLGESSEEADSLEDHQSMQDNTKNNGIDHSVSIGQLLEVEFEDLSRPQQADFMVKDGHQPGDLDSLSQTETQSVTSKGSDSLAFPNTESQEHGAVEENEDDSISIEVDDILAALDYELSVSDDELDMPDQENDNEQQEEQQRRERYSHMQQEWEDFEDEREAEFDTQFDDAIEDGDDDDQWDLNAVVEEQPYRTSQFTVGGLPPMARFSFARNAGGKRTTRS